MTAVSRASGQRRQERSEVKKGEERYRDQRAVRVDGMRGAEHEADLSQQVHPDPAEHDDQPEENIGPPGCPPRLGRARATHGGKRRNAARERRDRQRPNMNLVGVLTVPIDGHAPLPCGKFTLLTGRSVTVSRTETPHSWSDLL